MIATRAVEIAGDFADPIAVWQWFLESLNRVPGITIPKYCGVILERLAGLGLTPALS